MSDRYNSVRVTNGNIDTALGAALVDGDRAYLRESNDSYYEATSMSKPTIDLLLLHALPGWTGDLGNPDSGAAYLTFECDRTSTGKALCHWGGRYMGLKGGGGKILNYLEVKSARGDGRVVVTDWTTITEAVVEQGTLHVLSDADVNLVRMNGGRLHLTESANVTTTLNVGAGVALIERQVNALDCIGGETIKRLDGYSLGSSGGVIVRNGATLRVEGVSSIGTLLEVQAGGTLDFSRLTRELDVSGITVRLHAGATVIMPALASLITFPSAKHVGSGPRYLTP